MSKSGDSNEYLSNMYSVEKTLQELGRNSQEVCATLLKLGIKGNRQRCASCPLTQYLHLKGFVGATVHAYHVSIPMSGGVKPAAYGMPVAIQRFVEEFDRGKFTELEA